MNGFKNFIMRGNLVQLAVALVIGAQFSGLVKQFVSSFIDPLLAPQCSVEDSNEPQPAGQSRGVLAPPS